MGQEQRAQSLISKAKTEPTPLRTLLLCSQDFAQIDTFCALKSTLKFNLLNTLRKKVRGRG